MTEQELIERAIESAKCRIYRVKANEGESHRHQTKVANQVELQLVTIKALEKQIAKKPTNIDNELNTFKCPSCKHTLIAIDDMTIHKHCLLCGQKLDWGNEDEKED